MRILQISSHYNQGGAARIVAHLHRQWRRRGLAAHVAYGRGKSPQNHGEEGLFCFDKPWEVYGDALFSRLSGYSGLGNKAGTRRLLAYMEELQPDVAHLHAIHGYVLHLPMLLEYLRRRGIRWLWTFHDCYAFTGNCGYFFDCSRWLEGCGSCPDIGRYPASWFFDRSRRLLTQKKALLEDWPGGMIVSPSAWLDGEVGRSFLAGHARHILPNGVDGSIFHPMDKGRAKRHLGLAEGEKWALAIAVGFGDERKGGRLLLEAARALKGRVRLVLIGCPPALAKAWSKEAHILALPPVADPGVLACWYNATDVFVLPSLAENYATVSLEALSCGTPVAMYALGGTPEQLAAAGPGSGLAVEPGSVGALAEAVEALAYGRCAVAEPWELHARMMERHSLEAMAEGYWQAYNRICES